MFFMEKCGMPARIESSSVSFERGDNAATISPPQPVAATKRINIINASPNKNCAFFVSIRKRRDPAGWRKKLELN